VHRPMLLAISAHAGYGFGQWSFAPALLYFLTSSGMQFPDTAITIVSVLPRVRSKRVISLPNIPCTPSFSKFSSTWPR
jgi:hypothetical protein